MKKRLFYDLNPVLVILIETAAAVLTFFAVSFIFTLFASLSENPTSLIGIFSLISLLVSGALFGFVTSRIMGEGSKLSIPISALCTVLIMIAIGLIWSKGTTHISTLLNYLTYIGVAVIFSYLGRIRPKRKKYY